MSKDSPLNQLGISNRQKFVEGMKTGIPIALGYFAVSLSLGIHAKAAGLSAFQASLTSFFMLASAGEYATFSLIAESAGYVAIAVMVLIANARYFLMSCAFSQRISKETSLAKRILLSFYLTDEMFGASISQPGYVNPFFCFGIMALAQPAWTIGTGVGVVLGNALPAGIVSALSVSLYGMFLAVIIPAGKKNKIILGLVTVSMLASYLCTVIPYIKEVSSGIITIILTLLISSIAALLFPVKEETSK
ncbi:MAG: AzlC family ABC transporter permease [Ruminococcaceae bacterium]|nr:AzlC family ABC transporter permease [Oscillospiraceae bacterium]